MHKDLSARIAERVKKQRISSRDQNRAVFLALRPEIAKAMQDGWSVMTIWRTLKDEDKITFSYQAFRLYVNKLVHPSAPPGSSSNQSGPSGTGHPQKASGFTFNPIPNLEELI